MTVEAVPLAPLEVEVRSRFLEKQGVYWRIDHDRVTHLFDSDDLIERMRERGSPLLGHAFTGLPGLRVWYLGGPYFVGSRGCEIPVYWDGMMWGNPYGHFDDIPPEAVEVVEVYIGPRTPRRFERWRGDLNDCGAILFWSKERASRTRTGAPPEPGKAPPLPHPSTGHGRVPSSEEGSNLRSRWKGADGRSS